MTPRIAAVLLLCLPALALNAVPSGAGGGDEAQKIPAGVTCCDEQKIRMAMTEEALSRVAALAGPAAGGSWQDADYLSRQAFTRIRKYLPAGAEARLAFMRQVLRQPAADADIREFQELIGNFVLGMTLEIGNYLQDEYDQAKLAKEKVDALSAELRRNPPAGSEVPAQALFQAGISKREVRRVRALARKWPEPEAGAPAFEEFNSLRKLLCGSAADPAQSLVFELAQAHRPRFPFLDEFMENYRKLAGEFRDSARQLNEVLAFSPE